MSGYYLVTQIPEFAINRVDFAQLQALSSPYACTNGTKPAYTYTYAYAIAFAARVVRYQKKAIKTTL